MEKNKVGRSKIKLGGEKKDDLYFQSNVEDIIQLDKVRQYKIKLGGPK